MKRSRAVSAVMFAAVWPRAAWRRTCRSCRSSSNELKATLQTQARALEAQGKAIQRLETENAALKSQDAAPSGLETEINRLSERMGSATNLRSCASQIRLGGEFRYRGYYANSRTRHSSSGRLTTQTRDGTWATRASA